MVESNRRNILIYVSVFPAIPCSQRAILSSSARVLQKGYESNQQTSGRSGFVSYTQQNIFPLSLGGW